MTKSIKANSIPAAVSIEDTGRRLRTIENIDQLIVALRDNRAPRGLAKKRNDCMRQARVIKGVIDSMTSMNIGNSNSTYNGMYPQTIGEALNEQKREAAALGQQCVDLLPYYIWQMENPPVAKKSHPVSLDENAPVLKLEPEHIEVLEQFNEGLTNVSELAFKLAEFNIYVYQVRAAHRGDYVHGTKINLRGTLAYVLTSVQSDNETLEFTTVIL